MIYAYIRISTGHQQIDGQRYEIEKYCKRENISVNKWVEETVSGTKSPTKRALGTIINDAKEGDIIITSALSRLGRNMYAVADVLNKLIEKKVQLWTIQENFRLSDDITAKILSTCLLLVSELERNFISERTKAALEAKRAAGVKLGRPKGALGRNTKLTPYEDTIRVLIERDNTYAEVSRLFDVDRSTLKRFCDSRGIKRPVKCNEI